MNHDFKLKFDQLKENDPTAKERANNYDRQSSVRNVCFIQPDGNRIFLNYGYLVSGEYLPSENKVILGFTSHTINLIGIQLEGLYNDLMVHLPLHITCHDERYNSIEKDKSVINSMEIIKV